MALKQRGLGLTGDFETYLVLIKSTVTPIVRPCGLASQLVCSAWKLYLYTTNLMYDLLIEPAGLFSLEVIFVHNVPNDLLLLVEPAGLLSLEVIFVHNVT
jgi:hypothetical protein